MSFTWTVSPFIASMYPIHEEAEARAILLVTEHPEWIGKLTVKDLGQSGRDLDAAQGNLF